MKGKDFLIGFGGLHIFVWWFDTIYRASEKFPWYIAIIFQIGSTIALFGISIVYKNYFEQTNTTVKHEE